MLNNIQNYFTRLSKFLTTTFFILLLHIIQWIILLLWWWWLIQNWEFLIGNSYVFSPKFSPRFYPRFSFIHSLIHSFNLNHQFQYHPQSQSQSLSLSLNEWVPEWVRVALSNGPGLYLCRASREANVFAFERCTVSLEQAARHRHDWVCEGTHSRPQGLIPRFLWDP